MKILQLHNSYLYPGGEDIVAESEARMLRNFGHQVIEFRKNNKSLERLQGLAKSKFFLKDAFFSNEIYKEIKGIIDRDRPDIAHAHNSFFMIGPAAYQACFDAKLPVVQTLHNYRFLCAAATFYRDGHPCEDCLHSGVWKGVVNRCWHNSFGASLFLTHLIESYKRRRILNGIKKFIVLSEFSKNKFIQGGFDVGRIVVKPNFLEIDPGQTSFEGKYVLYVGALQEYKGISTLLRAWTSQSWPMKLKIVGTGPLEAMVKQKVGSQIEYLGGKNHAEVIELIKGSLCVVVPSVCYETFGRVIIESFACGVPAVVSNIGSLSELVKDKFTGRLFEPNNVQNLIAVLSDAVTNPQYFSQMGKNARQLYKDQYQADANYRQLIQIYKDVLTSKSIFK